MFRFRQPSFASPRAEAADPNGGWGKFRAGDTGRDRPANRSSEMVRTGGLEPPRAYALRIFLPPRLSPPRFDIRDAESEFVVWTIPSP
jgi:hypothetical protein